MKTPARQHRGFTAVYGFFVMMAMLAVVSLGVDWGRVQAAKQELRDAVDAAARYAATGLSSSSTLTRAQQSAVQNSVDGAAFSLSAANVEEGYWDYTNRAFVVSATTKTAVRVTGSRSVPLLFLGLVGRNTVNVNAIAVASRPPLPIGVVGLGGITLSTGTTIRRIATETGTVLAAANSNFTLNGTAEVTGDALYRGTAPGGTVTGATTLMSADIACASVAMPGGVTPAAYSFGSGAYPVAGTFYASQVTINGTAVLNLVGDTTIYCSGNVNIGGNCVINAGAYKLTLYLTSSSPVTMTNANMLRMVIYAPQSPVNLTGAGGLTGSIVGNTVSVSSGTVQFTSTMPIPVLPTGGGAALVPPIATVK